MGKRSNGGGGNRIGFSTLYISVIYMIPNAEFPTCSPTDINLLRLVA